MLIKRDVNLLDVRKGQNILLKENIIVEYIVRRYKK